MNKVSMEVKRDNYGCSPCPESKYGYGTSISLSDEQCKALGLTSPLPAGTVVAISATAIVQSATESVSGDSDDKGNEVRLNLQITELGLEPEGTSSNPAEVLYRKSS